MSHCPSCDEVVRPGARFCPGCGARLPTACPACGSVVSPSARFCEACGAPLTASGPLPAAGSGQAPPPPKPAPPPVPVSFAAGRYEVRRFLGEGGRKRVYQAYDRALDREVAVATVKTEDLDAGGLERVRREAQAMGRLGDHPHIVTVYDIGEEDGRPFIVSQYMPGGSVDDLLAAATDRRLPIADALRIGDELCQALEHAHSRGIIHRDIKPANVWLTEDGSTRLGDFGLATAADRSRLTTEGMVVGTVAYMAPEQALGWDIDARADLYAVGALLYECLTGRPPFVGTDAVAVISQQLNAVPMAPLWHNADVPKPLGALVMELLAKTPEERPAHAGHVRQRLLEIAAAPPPPVAEASGASASAPGRHSNGLDRTGRLVGRAEELASLKAGVEETLQLRGRLFLVVGEPGMGKTRLVEEAAVYARLRSFQVLVGHCYETESSLPYLPFVEAIRSYVSSQPPETLREELGGGASDVAKLVSEIRSRLPEVPAAPAHDAEEERYRLFESISTFLVNASRTHPILLILDDLHVADVPTLRLLQHLTRHLADSRLLVFGTYEESGLQGSHPLAQILVELRRDHRYERIGLRALTLQETGEVIAAIAEDNVEVDPSVIKTLHQHTDGNPFFTEEIIRHLLETGGAYSEKGRWVVDPAAVADLAVPKGVHDLIEGRLSRLPDGCRDLLTQAAVVGRQFDFATLGAMTGLEEDPLLEAVEVALRAQIIVEKPAKSGEDALYTFTHAILRQILYSELSRPRRQRLHRRAAEAVEAVHSRNLGPHLAALALHWRQSGTGGAEKALDYSVRAGEAALAVFAYEDVVQHWEAALESGPEDLADADPASSARRAQLLQRLGDLKYGTGLDFRGGIACLERALRLYERLGDSERVAQTHSRLGRHLATGTSAATVDIPRALHHYRKAEAILTNGPDTVALGYVHAGLALAAIWGMRTQDGLTASARAVEVAEKLGHERLWVTAAAQRGHHLASNGKLHEGMRLVEQAWERADGLTHTVAAFSATWIAAVLGFRCLDPRETQRWCRRELGTPRQSLGSRDILSDLLARALAQSGDLNEACQVREQAGAARLSTPYLALLDGDWEQAAALWTKQNELARRTGNRWAEHVSGYWSAVVRRWEGDSTGAEKLLRDALALATEGGNVPAELVAVAELTLLLADTGHPLEAASYVEHGKKILAGGEDWRGAAGRVALSEAATLVANGLVDEAGDRFGAAIATFQEFSLPWDEAEAWHRWGRARLDAGDRAGALDPCSRALSLYQRHGAGRRWIEPVLGDKLVAQGVEAASPSASIDGVAAAALDERPDLARHAAPDGTVTLLFSDIEGSTASNERLGDRRWLELLHTHNRIVRQAVGIHRGFEVKAQGDGFMVAFSSARRGLECAIGIQQALREHGETHPGETISVRIGLHSGEMVKEGDDFFGKNVALAARVAGAARGGEILVSSLVKELADTGEIAFGPAREVELKGLSGRRRVHEVLWEQAP